VGTFLLGVKAVLGQSYKRIHSSNFAGTSVLPLHYKQEENAESFGLTGEEQFSITGTATDIRVFKISLRALFALLMSHSSVLYFV